MQAGRQRSDAACDKSASSRSDASCDMSALSRSARPRAAAARQPTASTAAVRATRVTDARARRVHRSLSGRWGISRPALDTPLPATARTVTHSSSTGDADGTPGAVRIRMRPLTTSRAVTPRNDPPTGRYTLTKSPSVLAGESTRGGCRCTRGLDAPGRDRSAHPQKAHLPGDHSGQPATPALAIGSATSG